MSLQSEESAWRREALRAVSVHGEELYLWYSLNSQDRMLCQPREILIFHREVLTAAGFPSRFVLHFFTYTRCLWLKLKGAALEQRTRSFCMPEDPRARGQSVFQADGSCAVPAVSLELLCCEVFAKQETDEIKHCNLFLSNIRRKLRKFRRP